MSSAVSSAGVVVVGTGFGVITHVRALRNAGFDVRALVGRDAVKCAKRAALFEIPRACTTLAEALEDRNVVAVTIATPPDTHAQLVLEAVHAGKHVLCEKPFAMDTAQALEMLIAAERAGVVHALGVEYRFSAAHELLRRSVHSGLIGEPRHALFTWLIPLLADPAAQAPDWWMDATRGGGFLGASGSHVIDQVRMTLGEFSEVSARMQTLSGRVGMTADDSFTAQFRLKTGVEGVFVHSMAAPGELFSLLRISGTRGGIWLQGEEVWAADLRGNKRCVPLPPDLVDPAPVPFPYPEILETAYERGHAFGADIPPYTRLFRAFRARIEGDHTSSSPPLASFFDGVSVQAVTDAMRRSSSEGAWVKVSS